MPSLISQTDIDHIQIEAESVLPDVCTIRTATTASDGQGGNSPTFSDTYTDVRCRLSPFTRRQIEEMEIRGQIMTRRPFWLTISEDQTIGIKDKVVKATITYEVSYIDNEKSYAATKRVQIVRVEAS